MKLFPSSLRRGLLLTAFALAPSLTVSAADTFEGRVHMDITSGKKKEVMGMDYAMKDKKVRVDPQISEQKSKGKNGGMGVIMNMEAREMIILMDMDGKKMFMRRPIPQPTAEENGKVSAGGHKMSPPEATGRTEMIAGYKATEYRMVGEKGEVIFIWLAKGLGPFMSYSGGNPMGGRGAPPPGWESFARDGNAFPMRVVTMAKDGAESMRMEVTKVEKVSLPDSLFSTDGYEEFQMPDFGGAFNPFKKH